MVLELDIKKSLNLSKVLKIFKFEIYLQRKRYIILLVLSALIYNLISIFMVFLRPPSVILFVSNAVGQFGSFLMLLCIFFAGGILANEFDKKTALTNFTKTGRNNFFIGKTMAAFTGVLAWITIPFVESIIFCLALYQQVPMELFQWFGFYCLDGFTYIAIYLLFSAICRSGSQAMTMAFIFFIAMATAFGLTLAFANMPYIFPIYAEVVGQSLFMPETEILGSVISIPIAIIMLLCYAIPSLILAHLVFRARDV